MAMKTRKTFIHNDIPTPISSNIVAPSNEIKTLVGDIGSISTIPSKTKGRKIKVPLQDTDKNFLTSEKMKIAVKKNISYPCGDLYKADSDEFKTKDTKSEKHKKSVLTLPTKSAPLPNECTVSDMTDYSLENAKHDNKSKQTMLTKKKCKCKVRETGRSVHYRNELLNTGVYANDNKTKNNKTKKESKSNLTENKSGNGDLTEMWSVLRSVNQIQFGPSSIISEDSEIHLKQNKAVKPLHKHKFSNKRLIEQCRTEEIAYRIEFSEKSKTLTPESSLSALSSNGQITATNEIDQFHKLCKKVKTRLQNQIKNSDKSTEANATKACNKLQSAKTLTIKSDPKEKKKFVKPSNMNDKYFQNSTKQFERGDASSGSSKARRFYEHGRVKKKQSKREINCADQVKDDAGNNNGIIKVVFNNEKVVKENSLDSSFDERDPPPLPRLRNPLKSPTQKRPGINELRRQLARIKFPVAVTGRDELSSTIEVSNQSPPQFDGLEKQIWPFMKDWVKKSNQITNSQTYSREHNFNSIKLQNQSFARRNAAKEKLMLTTKQTKVIKDHNLTQNKNITELQNQSFARSNVVAKEKIMHNTEQTKVIKNDNLIQNKNITGKIQQPKKNSHLKEKLVNLFYKNKNTICENNIVKKTAEYVKDQAKQITAPDDHSYCMNKHNYGKGRRASAFIENVMNKVFSGIYYNKDIPKEAIECDKNKQDERKNKLNQVEQNALLPATTMKPNDIFATILAYDEILNNMQVNTKNTQELELKHNIANIVVRFDIALQSFNECAQVFGSSTCISITDPDSNLKVFKSNTILFNHMLPASVCTLMPIYIRSILSNTKYITLEPKNLRYRDPKSSLLTVTELAPTVNISSSQLPRPKLTVDETIPLVPLCKKILRKGHFGNPTATKKIADKKTSRTVLHRDSCQQISRLATKVSRPWSTQDNSNIRVMLSYCNNKNTLKKFSACNIDKVPVSAINPHIVQNRTLISSSGFDVNSIMVKMMHYFNSQIKYCFNLPTNISRLKIWYSEENTQLSISFGMINYPDSKEIITIKLDEVDFSNVNVHNFGNNMKSLDYHKTTKIMEDAGKSSKNLDMNVKTHSSQVSLKSNKIRNKRYIKLYKKCSSMSNIQEKKSVTLNKITTMEDFFQILGLKQTLVGVMNGDLEKKIMESLSEMKSWISEISPRQALLVFLLSNKKDTPSLVRLRPVVLQAIAVNRITRSSELDMEIEVIVKEQIYPVIQQDDPAVPPDKQNFLFDELIWIAKTTASDYKRPFNEDSERLIKSLLSKRINLNPSYLRVMARYVGLGLLKSPGKK